MTVEIDDRRVMARLNGMPRAVQQYLEIRATRLALKLEAHVKTDKLQGQVLRHVTGRLSRSIHNETTFSPGSVIGRVFSDGSVKYAAIHEFGGQTPPHVIEAKKAQALAFMMGGTMMFRKRVNHPGSKMPERSFLRSSLGDMAPEIEAELKGAVIEGLNSV